LFHVKHLLPNAKPAENLAEHVLDIDPPGDAADRILRQPDLLRHDFRWQLRSGHNAFESSRRGGQRLPVPLARQGRDFATDFEPLAGEIFQLGLELIEPDPCRRRYPEVGAFFAPQPNIGFR
jgi:hypothetical protein